MSTETSPRRRLVVAHAHTPRSARATRHDGRTTTAGCADTRRVKFRKRAGDERGYVLVWMALLLTVLMGFAGFGVDTAKLWYSAQKMQKAADAAALGGVVFLPGDLAGGIAEARKIAAQNGYIDGVNGDVVTPFQDPTNPDRLDVTISHTEKTTFVALLGVKQVGLKRTAVAEYQGPVPMGSPMNNLGNQPTWTGTPTWPAGTSLTAEQTRANTTPQLWANIAGPNTDKGNGDRFTTTYCSSSFYNCSSSSNIEPQAVTADPTYGYYYVLKGNVTDLSKRLAVQVYDPAFIQQGDTCTAYSTNSGDEATFEAALTTVLGPGGHPNQDPANANAASYCPGDNTIRSGYTAPTTYFQVEKPDLTPWNDTDNTPVATSTCSEANSFQISRDPAAPQGTFPGFNGGLSTDAPGTAGVPTGSMAYDLKNQAKAGVGWYPQYISSVFHNYVTVCNASMSDLGITATGTYNVILRARVSAGSAGHNRFAIRGAMVNDTSNTSPDGSKVSVYADGKLPIYMNASGANSIFYIARLMPNNSSHTLQLNLYDVGDAAANGSITILPPVEATSGGSALSSFSGCLFSRAPTAINAGDAVGSTCTLNKVNTSNGYNGQLVVVDVPVPANYNCNSTSGFGCWVRVQFVYPTGTGVTDTTTWTANLKGDPVRLVA